jgi:NADH dehydrogenase
MYQIATGGLEPDSIAYPIRRIFRGYKNVTFRMAKMNALNTVENEIETSIGVFPFDYLIIATGSKLIILILKSIPDALNLRSFIFQNLEKSLISKSTNLLKKY